MNSYNRLLTELQETGRCSLHSVTTLGELVYLCDTLGLDLNEMLIDGWHGTIEVIIKGGKSGKT